MIYTYLTYKAVDYLWSTYEDVDILSIHSVVHDSLITARTEETFL